jgi:hypothetical protein
VFISSEDFLVVNVIKMTNITFIFISDTVMDESALLVNVFRNWWWNIFDVVLWRVVRSGSSMEQFCTSFSRWKNRIHILLV